MLCMKHSVLWLRNFVREEEGIKVSGKFRDVVVEKNGLGEVD